MIPEYERYPFVERDPDLKSVSLAPFLPIELIGRRPMETLALLDTGASVNVSPHGIGIGLGAVWDHAGRSLPLAGNLAGIDARLLALFARVGGFPVVKLVFAWAISDSVPLLLGQFYFFLEFDVCFHRSRGGFEIRPKTDTTSANPD